MDSEFENFKVKFKKRYSSPQEEQFRKDLFIKNYKDIVVQNQLSSSFKSEINQFADMTDQEFESNNLMEFELPSNPTPSPPQPSPKHTLNSRYFFNKETGMIEFN